VTPEARIENLGSTFGAAILDSATQEWVKEFLDEATEQGLAVASDTQPFEEARRKLATALMAVPDADSTINAVEENLGFPVPEDIKQLIHFRCNLVKTWLQEECL
jgi:3-methyladenine DNA glycosylase/8-oxoguanine DNA glycosylase